jgi:phosphohistidine phosphatase
LAEPAVDPGAVQVFLIRHAEAVDETLALTDPARYLTGRGRAQARALGDRLRWHDVHPHHIWTSPLCRALQTAELVGAPLTPAGEVVIEVVPALAPEESPRAVAAAIVALPPTTVLLVVGHEPGLSALGVLLTGSRDFPALAKAEAARVDDARVRWRFAWNAEAPAIARASSRR